MRSTRSVVFIVVLVLFAACSTYKANPELNYYHGQNVPEGFITILRASPMEIEFEIRVDFTRFERLYHLVLDGNTPVAEGWFRTLRVTVPVYAVTMTPKKGLTFEAGKTYRLCIGQKNPQEVQMTSSNYPCLVDHTFVFQEKS
ncbi:MAG: hypothetical protein WBC70_16785 [Candidatus Aminicenantales bacterium]